MIGGQCFDSRCRLSAANEQDQGPACNALKNRGDILSQKPSGHHIRSIAQVSTERNVILPVVRASSGGGEASGWKKSVSTPLGTTRTSSRLVRVGQQLPVLLRNDRAGIEILRHAVLVAQQSRRPSSTQQVVASTTAPAPPPARRRREACP